MTRKTLLNPKKDPTAQGIISDIIIGIQPDRCTTELCPRMRLVVTTANTPKVVVLNPHSLKHFIMAFSAKISKWFGQEVSLCTIVDEKGQRRTTIFPIKP